MTLYSVHELDGFHDNALLVVATTPKRAVRFWMDHYGLTVEDIEEKVIVYRCDHDLKTEGAIGWAKPGSMVQVGYMSIKEWLK